MSNTININGTAKGIHDVNANGLPMDKIFMNDILVWQRPPTFDRIVEVSDWGGLRDAVSTVAIGEKVQIIAANDLEADAPNPNAITIPANRDITLAGGTLTQTTANQRHFIVNGILRLCDITLRGDYPNETANHGGMQISAAGHLLMESGSVIEKCRNTAAGQAAGVTVHGGLLTISGGEIRDNNAFTESVNAGIAGGVIVLAGGCAEMHSGSIHGNEGRFGGAVAIQAAASFAVGDTRFIMRGGEIHGNTARLGGGVNAERGTFEMSGGTIRGNTATALANPPGTAIAANRGGGGVFVQNAGRFEMTGGSIRENQSGNNGGGVMMLTGTAFDMADGEIAGNRANSHGHGVFVTAGAAFNAAGGTIDDMWP